MTHSGRSSSRWVARGKAASAQLPPKEQHLITSFHPRFVYPLFGEEEIIYGYEDLDVQVRNTFPESQRLLSNHMYGVHQIHITPKCTKEETTLLMIIIDWLVVARKK
jgi:hypothetical protein